MGGITGATARLAARPTRLSCPETAATRGAVTSCAAAATQTASATGLGHPRAVNLADQSGAATTRAAVASTESANPISTANSGARTISRITVADNAGTA